MICPECSHENVDTAKFCNECGFRFPASAPFEAPAAEDAAVEPEVEPVTVEIESNTKDESETEPDTDPDAAPEANAEAVHEPHEHETEYTATDQADADFEEFDYSNMGDIDVSADVTVPIPELPVEEEIPPASTTAVLDGLDNILAEEYIAPSSKWRTGDTMQMEPVSATSESTKNKKFTAPDINLKMPRTSGIVLKVLGVIVVIAAVIGFAGYQMEFWGGKAVPDVIGMAEADAIFVLEGKGFIAKSMQTKSDDTEGLVLMTDPGAGGRQDLGKEIVIHVAAARVVPDIKNCSKDEALAKLEAEGFENVAVKTQKSDEKAGTALDVVPKPGEKGKAATPITLYVSEPYCVPEIIGKTEDEAMRLIKDEKLKIEIVDTYTDEVAENTVISTDPAVGTALKSGKTVRVEFARSKATRLVNATYDVIGPGADIRLDGINYHVDSVDAVNYEGNNVTSYTITASPFTTLLGERLSLGSRSITGTLTWNDDGKLVSADPEFTSL